jgi:hypothetical protein
MADTYALTPTARIDPMVVAATTRAIVRRLVTPAPERPRLPLELIDRCLRCYEVEFRGFLNRQRRCPPVDLAATLREAFRALSRVEATGPPALHLQALESRFHASERLFSQRLGERERSVAALRPLRN